jgi:tetratricopeptide (TPR) repeat protein
VLKRVLYLCVLLIGMIAVALRTTKSADLDDRRGEWILYATIVALGMFLVHNLIDFAMFENGPLFIFAILCGSAIGTRLSENAVVTEGDHAGETAQGKVAPVVGLAALAVAWLASAIFLVGPVVAAEAVSDEGDDVLSAARPAEAARLLETASERAPFNADYAFRAARAMMFANAPPQRVRAALDRAIAANPDAPESYHLRAYFEIARPEPDHQRVLADFKRLLDLNPQDVSGRLDYAAVLARFGDAEESTRQRELARRFNDALEAENPKRLSPSQFDEAWKTAQDRMKPALPPAP